MTTISVTAQSGFSFSPNTSFVDGTPMTPAQVAALTFAVLIDTVNPPSKAFPVPAANVAAIAGGVITVKFTDIGFVPAPNVPYFATAVETEGVTASPLSNVIQILEQLQPAAPTGFTVA